MFNRHLLPAFRKLFLISAMLLAMTVCGCAGIPENVTAVDGFEVQRYLGTWYELARLDHSFERGLSRVTATYTAREDGGIDVLNKGYDDASGEWKEAAGIAYFVDKLDIGRLKVSFFGPFYGGYNIIALDKEHYSYSLVCGSSRSYLWLLARAKKLDPAIQSRLLAIARDLEFPVDDLILVEQGEVPPAPAGGGP